MGYNRYKQSSWERATEVRKRDVSGRVPALKCGSSVASLAGPAGRSCKALQGPPAV